MTNMAEAPSTIATDDVPLTLADRCDKCGAEARVRVIMPSGFDLLFCGHHEREYAAVLLAVGARS